MGICRGFGELIEEKLLADNLANAEGRVFAFWPNLHPQVPFGLLEDTFRVIAIV